MAVFGFAKLAVMLASAIIGAYLSSIKPSLHDKGWFPKFASELYVCSGVAIFAAIPDIAETTKNVGYLSRRGIEFPAIMYAVVIIFGLLIFINIPAYVAASRKGAGIIPSAVLVIVSIFAIIHLYGMDLVEAA